MHSCSVPGEDHSTSPTLRRGMCQKHYLRWKKENPDYVSKYPYRGKSLSPEEILKSHGWTVTDTGCWEWSGSRLSNGYGRVNVAGRVVKTHRLSHETWVGPIPEGHVVRHKCDNPPCINPDHLETGTVADNHGDMWARGRAHRTIKFPDETVRWAREQVVYGGRLVQDVAQELGSSTSVVSRWVNGSKRVDAGGPIQEKTRTKLDWDKVHFIRGEGAGMTNKDLAKLYGVDPSVISKVRSGDRWCT